MTRAAASAFALMALLATPAAAGDALALLYVERSGCPWCQRFEREAMKPYELSDLGKEAPLRRVSLDHGQPDVQGLAEPVRFTPTFILIKDGREVARIVGYQDNAAFFGLVDKQISAWRGKQGDRS